MGLADTQTIARIIVHPSNPDIVYVAASGHEWTDNENRGVFKTTDGGRTLEEGPVPKSSDGRHRSRHGSLQPEHALRGDVAAHPAQVERSARRAGLQRRRHLARRRTAAQSWTEMRARACRRRSIAAASASTSRARIRACSMHSWTATNRAPPRAKAIAMRTAVRSSEARIRGAEIYRTDDKGTTWRKVSETNAFMSAHSGTYGWVFGQIRVDPKDDKTIYTLGLGLNVSHDGGKSLTAIRGTHGDHHGLWIDPDNPATLYNANDGGVYLSSDAGATWKFAVIGGRLAVLQRHGRQQHSGVGLRIDSGYRQPSRKSRHQQRP